MHTNAANEAPIIYKVFINLFVSIIFIAFICCRQQQKQEPKVISERGSRLAAVAVLVS